MKDYKIKHFLALVLAVSMILSDVSVAVYATEEQTQPVYCGLQEHTHGDTCVNSDGLTLCPLEEHDHIEACYITNEPEVVTETEENTSNEIDNTEEVIVAELSLLDQLMATQTLQELYALMAAEAAGMKSLTASEVSAVKSHAEILYAAIENPSEDEQESYTQIMDALSLLLNPEETETEEIIEEEAEATEEEEATDPVELPLMDRLMTTQTLQELYDLVVAESEGMEALSLGEVSAVKTQTQALYSAIESPTEEEQGYYTYIMDILSQRLGDNKPVRATSTDLSNGGGTVSNGEYEWKLSRDTTVGNVSKDTCITVNSSATLTIDLNGYVLTVPDGKQFASVSGKLIIKDSDPNRTNSKGQGGFITGTGNTVFWGGAICVESGGELVIEGGTISNFAGDRGGAIHSAGTIHMSGGTITGNTASTYGGAINSRGTFTMTGGTISGNTAPNGGGITIGGGTFSMTDGTISGNTANTDGGGIYTWHSDYGSDPIVRISGGTISGNTAPTGGGVTVSSGTFTMTGGTISSNTANTDGGGIYTCRSNYTDSDPYVTISGGTISKNKGAWGGGIHAAKGTLKISGGTIAENEATTNGGGISFKNSSVQLTGGFISKNTANSYGGGIMMENGTLTMEGGSITENKAKGSNGGGILIRDGKFTMTSGSIESNTASENGGGIMVESGADEFTMEGGNIDRNTARNGGGIAHQIAITISGGSISSNTASYGGGIYSMNTVNIGINTAEVEGDTTEIEEGTTETEGDSTETEGSTIEISANTAYNEGGGIFIENNGSLVMSGGTISQNTAKSANSNTANGNGGGIYVKSSTSAQITGGTIDRNTAGNGGGIYNAGTVTMKNGSVSNNQSPGGSGGGIHNTNQFTMTNGTISGNIAGYSSGTDEIDKEAVYYTDCWGGGIYTTGTFTMEGGTITENIAASGGGIGVWWGTFNMKGGTISYNKACGTGGPGNGGASYVNRGTFNFYGGTIEHNWARRYGGAINLNEGGKLFFHGDTDCIIQYNSANNGGGVSQEVGQCSISIPNNNIKIQYNVARDDNRPATDYLKADGYGGGLFIEMGTVTIAAGFISNNEAVSGGGMSLRLDRKDGDISFEMTGGLVSDNTATDTGGGIDIYASSYTGSENDSNDVVVNLKGGSFIGNKTTGGTDDEGNPTGTGGGIDIEVAETKASAVMKIGETGTNGPTLTNNTAVINGGAIRMRSGHVYLYSGTISGNSADQYGGGITVNGGDFEMSGGTIGGTTEGSANTAGLGGGGIALRVKDFPSDITVKMTGGTIIGNTAVNTGGGMDIYAHCDRTDSGTNDVRVNLLGGSFENNTSTAGTGGGIDIDVDKANSTAILNIGAVNTDGPQFTNNTAAQNGGAIRMRNGSITLHSGTIDHNSSSLNGGAISINGGDFTMNGGSVSKNQVTNGYGGGIALSNGIVLINDGSVASNHAKYHGGGVVVSNGEIIMTGGTVSDNVAETGNGGGLYITSIDATSDTNDSSVSVKIFSGEVSRNSAPMGSGGGLAVNGGQGKTKIFVQSGLNLYHDFTGDPATLIPIPHGRDGKTGTEFSHESCPVITANSSLKSGGGIFITGGSETNLNIYCLMEADNTTVEDADHTGVLSKFMMVEGGKVIISSSQTNDDGEIDKNTSGFGNTSVLSSVHVYAGELYLYGSMENPAFTDALTVDYRNPTDTYEDHRTSNTILKLTYNENFKDANGIPESTMKAFDIKVGTVVTIAELLFDHPGYTINSWHTDPNGDDDKGQKFDVGAKYLFIKTEADKAKYPLPSGVEYWMGDLNLYAVWDVNLYLVQYHHNIPEGEIYSGNMDGEHKFTYDKYQKLNPNAFEYPGHVFLHWAFSPTGQGPTLGDKELVKNLTDVRGDTVHLYAIWDECSHPETEISYSLSDQKDKLTKACGQCSLSASVTLQANSAVYDGNKHMYTVDYTNEAFFKPEVTCSAVKFGKTEAPDEMYVDAGEYTVTTNVAGTDTQATLTYRIEKADQRPPVAPTYTPPEGNGIVTIDQISNVLSLDSKAQVQYAVKYPADNDWVYSEWVQTATTTDKIVTITVDQDLTNYHVLARYPETDNYKCSDEVEAGESFFFDGNITVTILRTPGITHVAEGKDSGLELELGVEDGYYLSDNFYYVTVKSGDEQYIIIDDGADTPNEYKNTDGKFTITANKGNHLTENVSILLTVGTATKATTITSKIAPNQVFGTVSGNEATISRDSAYTVYFEVADYNSQVYTDPALVFDKEVPVGTKLILQDKSTGSYWSYAVDSKTSRIPLNDPNNYFVRMGGSDSFTPSGENWKLQFIVDFSQAASTNDLPNRLNTRLILSQVENPPENAPDLNDENTNPGVNVILIATSFGLTKSTDSGAIQTLSYSFNSKTANVSKWDYRELALILRPQNGWPADAVINATQGNSSVNYRSVQISKGTNQTETAFLIPLDSFSGEILLKLSSVSVKAGTYSMSAQLVAAQSIAEKAAANGTVVASVSDLTFTLTETSLSMKVTENNDCHLFAAGSPMNLNLQIQPASLPSGYKLIIALEQKKDNAIAYTFAGVYYEATGTGSNRTLSVNAPTNPGNYRIRFYIETANGTKVLETIYYFIAQ